MENKELHLINSETSKCLNEAKNRIEEIEKGTKTKENELFFVIWFRLVIDTLIEFSNIEYYYKNKNKVNYILDYYKGLLEKHLDGEKLKHELDKVDLYINNVNKEFSFYYFITPDRIPMLVNRKKLIDLNIGNKIKIVFKNDNGRKTTLKLDKEESIFTPIKLLSELITPNETYISTSIKGKLWRVLNKNYSLKGNVLFKLDRESSDRIPMTEIFSIYKKINNAFNTGRTAIIEIYERGKDE